MDWNKNENVIVMSDIKSIDMLKKLIQQNQDQFQIEDISSETCLALRFTKKFRDSKLKII